MNSSINGCGSASWLRMSTLRRCNHRLRPHAEMAIAAVIALDQFPRNTFRGTPRTFATDPNAFAIADRAIESGFDARLSEDQLRFSTWLTSTPRMQQLCKHARHPADSQPQGCRAITMQ